MAKNCWSKGLFLLVCGLLFLGTKLVAAESYSQFFIKITDAETAVSKGDTEQAKQLLEEFAEDFSKLDKADSELGQKVSSQVAFLLESDQISSGDLTSLSKKLLSFEEEQNPVDLAAEKANFKKKVYPALEKLEAVIKSANIDTMKAEYLTFNSVWTRNEAIVRSSEGGHYGSIETAMSFLRASMESEPVSQKNIETNLSDLKTALDNFMTGKSSESAADVSTLSQGISLLEEAYEAFRTGDKALAQEKMKTFIRNWPTFEGEVSTRSSSLYRKVESQTPIIMAKGEEADYQEQLQHLIQELSAIDSSAAYSFIDAMLILLREGVEALLIVLALVGSLRAAKQKKGLKWIYLGAIAGVLASVLVAILLQTLFPSLSSGSSREILEGGVGLLAVVMMIGIGVWLHGKSNMKAWKNYMQKQVNIAMSTGSFISMFALSFLAVFREGAETILFYIGIIPNISLSDLLLGIGLAVVALIVLAFILIYFSNRVPMHLIFRLLTWTIYLLAFKMLGVSIYKLQLTDVLPSHVIDSFPTIDWLGIYPNIECLSAQILFVLIVIFLRNLQEKRDHHG